MTTAIARTFAVTLVTVCFTTSTAEAQSRSPSQQTWLHDPGVALQQAKSRQLPVLFHFSASWCLPCQKMESSVLNQPVVKKLVGKNVIACKVDGDVYPELIQQFQIEFYPSDVLLDPNGRELARNQGDLDVVEYTQFLASSLPKKTPPAILPHKPSTLVAGLDGYCPVTLKRSRKWVKGSSDFIADYKGIQYRLQSQDILNAFNADPEKFAPKLLGCDPVVLTETHKAIPGFTKYGAFFDEKLFLFSTSENRTRFRENPLEFTRTRHAVKVDDIIRTAISPKESSSAS